MTVLGLVDTAARAACQPQRVWGRARFGRRRRAGVWRPAAQARPAGRAAVATRQTRAGDCSGPCSHSCASRMPAAACLGPRTAGRRPCAGHAGARRHKRARPAVRLPRRAKLGPVTVLGLVDTTARSACQPQRVWAAHVLGGAHAPVALAPSGTSPAGRAAVAPRQPWAGDCSGPKSHSRAARMPAAASLGPRTAGRRPRPAAGAWRDNVGRQARRGAAAAPWPWAGDCFDPSELGRAYGARAGARSGRRSAERSACMA